MSKKQQQTWTPYFNVHDIFEIYPNIDPNTREILRLDGTKGPKMPDGGVRLRFLNGVPKWYAQREKIYSDEFGPLKNYNPNPIEHLIQNKDDVFGGLYCYADSFYEPYDGSGYIGIGTSGRMSSKNGNDPFGCGSLSRIWKHVLKILGRHASCNIKLTGGWKTHKELRNISQADILAGDAKFSFFIDYVSDQQTLSDYESAMQEHRLGKYGSKFPINELPASILSKFHRLPI